MKKQFIFICLAIGCAATVACDVKKSMIKKQGGEKKAEDRKEVKPQITDDALAKVEITAPPEPGDEERCMGKFLKEEAARRAKEGMLEPLLIKARVHGILVDFIDSLVRTAGEKSFMKAEKLAADYRQRIEMAGGGASKDELKAIQNVVKVRLSAYASCMSVASRNTSWCRSVEKIWSDGAQDCYKSYAFYALIASEVIGKRKTCEEAFKKFPAFKQKEILAVCEALSNEKPGLCPWEDMSKGNIFCRSAATRGRTHICKKATFDEPELEYDCCEKFGWRFANVASGSASAYDIPETGALSGDEEGCARAMTWGLMEDLGLYFDLKIPDEIEKNKHDISYENYLCPLIIYWTHRKVP